MGQFLCRCGLIFSSDTFNFSSELLGCLLADSRCKHIKRLTILITNISGSESVTEEVESSIWVIPIESVAFTKNNPCLVSVNFEPTLGHSVLKSAQYKLRLLLTDAVNDSIICIPYSGIIGKGYTHPSIKSIVKKQICQHRANDSALRRSRVSFNYTAIGHAD